MADLCLGTAQLGMQYGINNKIGKLKQDTVYDILTCAMEKNIQIWDTASMYGEAEKLVGDFLAQKENTATEIRIISKQCKNVMGLSKNEIESSIRSELEESLKHLKRDFLDGYLLHSHRAIDNLETLKILRKLKEEGLVRHIGASVYELDEADLAIDTGNIDYLQMPCSLFDQRGLFSGVFEKAKNYGITVFTRSAFLQGLLMMEADEVPGYLNESVPYLIKFNELLQEFDLDKKHAVVKFILQQKVIDYMVFGVESRMQLEGILEEQTSSKLPIEFLNNVEQMIQNIPEKVILPIYWKKEK